MSQREFWRGDFGDQYIDRNNDDGLRSSNLLLFGNILQKTGIHPSSILELGANIGLNLEALRHLLPKGKFAAVEINNKAASILKESGVKVYQGSIEEVEIIDGYDLVFTKGVLIHIDPNNLELVYRKMFSASNKWILTIEYYSRSPEEILYRGHSGVLFKRDFAGELLDKFGGKLSLVDYGFVYHRDTYPQDDLTWFLLEKR